MPQKRSCTSDLLLSVSNNPLYCKKLKTTAATTHTPCGLQADVAEEAHEQCVVAGVVFDFSVVLIIAAKAIHPSGMHQPHARIDGLL